MVVVHDVLRPHIASLFRCVFRVFLCWQDDEMLTAFRTAAPMQYWLIIWGTLLAVALTFISVHGIYYVSWPLLNPLTDVIHYDGPGFRATSRGRGLGISDWSKSLLQYAPLSYREWVEKGHGRAKSRANEIEMGELAKKRLE